MTLTQKRVISIFTFVYAIAFIVDLTFLFRRGSKLEILEMLYYYNDSFLIQGGNIGELSISVPFMVTPWYLVMMSLYLVFNYRNVVSTNGTFYYLALLGLLCFLHWNNLGAASNLDLRWVFEAFKLMSLFLCLELIYVFSIRGMFIVINRYIDKNQLNFVVKTVFTIIALMVGNISILYFNFFTSLGSY